MPAPKRRRPAHFGCSTVPPRSTQISLLRSRSARSTAVSKPASVESSSALRWRGLVMVTTAALPSRSSCAPGRRRAPDFSNSGRRASASSRGSSMAWQRCAPAAGSASTSARKCPSCRSRPVLSRCARALSAAIASSEGSAPGKRAAACLQSSSTLTNRVRPAVTASYISTAVTMRLSDCKVVCKGRMNFYLVDDDPDILTVLTRVLQEAGHGVESSTSSRQALKQIPVSRPDCVITDIMMPEMDGFELTRELRHRPDLRDMKIVVLSAKTYDFDRRRARELGADGFISKPFQRATLLQSILEIVSSRVGVTYWGVHGTLPAPGAAYTRYGGNTPCVSVEIGGEPLYIFDCGSGIKRLSDRIMAAGAQRFSARIFISHTHWDHINTVPFFAPLYVRGNQIELFGPYQGDLTIERAVSAQMESVYFPVTVR